MSRFFQHGFLLLLFVLVNTAGPASAQSELGSVRSEVKHEFYFTRGIWEDGMEMDFGRRWAIDYPKADQQFLVALRRLTGVDAYESDHALRIGSPKLKDFPFLYVLELGTLSLD